MACAEQMAASAVLRWWFLYVIEMKCRRLEDYNQVGKFIRTCFINGRPHQLAGGSAYLHQQPIIRNIVADVMASFHAAHRFIASASFIRRRDIWREYSLAKAGISLRHSFLHRNSENALTRYHR